MNFEAFNFHPQIQTAIKNCGYVTPTPIQQESIPLVLEGHDMFGLAQTGTGKTAAFVLPILQRLLGKPRGKIQALVIAPTRELAEQIHENIGKMGARTGVRSVVIYGGVSKHAQVNKIRQGAEIVVACPGRLLDHLNDGTIRLDSVEVLVLDEADHMFDKGFLPDIRKIINNLPKKRQTLIFSATMPPEIRQLAEKILHSPKTVQLSNTRPAETISQYLYPVEQKNKAALLRHIMRQTPMTSTLVFTKTKHKAKNLATQLQKAGYSVTSLQGNLSQPKRQEAMAGFKSGKYKIMVATDIAARGIDVSGVSHVINFDMPDTVEAYTHRIGRTGRAAATGEAYTFVCGEDDRLVKTIERHLGKKIATKMVADFAPVPQEKPAKIRQAAPASNNRSRKPRPVGAGQRRGRRACSFDFGLNNGTQHPMDQTPGR